MFSYKVGLVRGVGYVNVISLIILSIILLMAAGVATASIITVNESGTAEYNTIQDAINNSTDGDIIVVFSGNYTENVVINKKLSLIAQNDTIVKAANSSDHVFRVTADNVNIINFTILNAEDESGIYLDGVRDNYIFNNNLMNNWNGIFLNNSYNNTLLNNAAFNNTDDGFYLYNSSNNTLLNNSIIFNYNGVHIEKISNNNIIINNNVSNNLKNGISLFSSINNTLNLNTANSNQHYGIYFSNSSNNILFNNTANLNGRNGIHITFSGYNKLLNNVISRNLESGIGLSNSINNTIFNNYFNNTKNVEFEGINTDNIWNISKTLAADIEYEGMNIWNLVEIPDRNIAGGRYLGGNLWEKFNGEGFSQTCIDENYDEICDQPSDIWEFDIDYLPLTASAVITVDDDGLADYTTIQAAVDNAVDGDTIVVFSGIYTENVNVDKELTIISESGNPEDTVIDVPHLPYAKNGENDGFYVTVDNVTIIGFSIKSWGAGIRIYYANNSKVSKVMVNSFDCVGAGILLDSSSNSLINSNNLSNLSKGIFLNNSINNELRDNKLTSNCKDIFLFNSNFNRLINNNAFKGTVFIENSNDNIVKNNNVSYSFYGIFIKNSINNVVNNNNFSNSARGIIIDNSNNNFVNNNNVSSYDYSMEFRGNSSDNIIFLNNFISSINNVDSTPGNIWHTPEKISYTHNGTVYSRFLGNFYSDYNGFDNDSDGIGDSNNSYDEQPLMNFSNTYEEIEAPIYINFYDENDESVANASEDKSFVMRINESYTIGALKSESVSNISIEIYNSSSRISPLNIFIENHTLGTMRFGPFSVTEDEMLNDSDSYMIVEARNVTYNNETYNKANFKVPIYITPFNDIEFVNENLLFHNITPYEWDKDGDLAVIASPTYEQKYAVEYFRLKNENITNNSLNASISGLANLQLIGLTEITKKWPDAKIIILESDVEIAEIDRIIAENRNAGKKVMIVGTLPHAVVTFNNVRASKAYSASYLSYTMATQVTNQKLWYGDNKTFVAKHFRANQYFNALNSEGKYDKEEFGDIYTEYPAILIALNGNPLLQASPTLGIDIRESINNDNLKDITTYKLGTLTPLGHTYYLGLDIEYKALEMHLGQDLTSLKVSIPFIIADAYIKGESNRYEDKIDESIVIGIPYPWITYKKVCAWGVCIKYPISGARYWNTDILDSSKKYNENAAFENIKAEKKKMDRKLSSVSIANKEILPGVTTREIVMTYYDFQLFFITPHAFISEREDMQYQMEPSNVHTVLSDTLKRMGTEDKPVSEIVIYQNENYPSNIRKYNIANAAISGTFNLIELNMSGVKVTPTYGAKAHVYNYVGASDDINSILIVDDLVLIDTIIEEQKLNSVNDTMIDVSKTFDTLEKTFGGDETREEKSKKTQKTIKNLKKAYDSFRMAYDQYKEAQEAADFNSRQLFLIGDPYLTGYDDPIDNQTIPSLPDNLRINLTSKFDHVTFLDTIFIYPNVTSYNTSFDVNRINSKFIIEEWVPFTGAPQTSFFTLSILHPSNQVIDSINYTFSDEITKLNVSLPIGSIDVLDETIPGIFENSSVYPLDRVVVGTEEFTNASHTVIRIFPTKYFANKTLLYYQNISISLGVNNTTSKPVDVHLKSYPNVLGIAENGNANISILVYNDLKATKNVTVDILYPLSSDLSFTAVNTTVELGTSVNEYYREFMYNIAAPDVDEKETFMLNVTLRYNDSQQISQKNYSIPVVVVSDNLVELELTNVNIPDNLNISQSYNISATVKNSGQTSVIFVPFKLFLDYDKVDEKELIKMDPDETFTEHFSFTPTQSGEFNMTVAVSAAPDEIILENNYYTKTIQIMDNITVLEAIAQQEDGKFNLTAGSVGEKPENIILSEVSRQYVYANHPTYYGFIKEGNAISYIQFIGLKDSGIIPARVEMINEKCTLVDSHPSGVLYYYVGITVGNVGWASSETIKDSRIGFKVAKDWIVTENIDISTIAMYRYEGNTWAKLYTDQIDEDEDYLYFDSATPSFSLFSISAQRIKESVQITESEVSPKTGEVDIAETPFSTMEPKFRGVGGVSIALVLLSLLILLYYIYNRRNI